MKSIKKISFAAFGLSILATISLNASEPVCHRCEEIREYNAEHHQNFEYYDDYLNTHKEEKTAASLEQVTNKQVK